MKKSATVPRIVNFDPEAVKAPVLLRCAAFLIDYLLIVFFPVLALVLGRLLGNDGSKLLNSEISSFGWVLALLIALANLLFLPLYTCQSVGKMLTGLKVVGKDGGPPTLGALALRHSLGYLVTALTFGIGFLIAVLGSSGRALHDKLGKTYVIYAEEKPAGEA